MADLRWLWLPVAAAVVNLSAKLLVKDIANFLH